MKTGMLGEHLFGNAVMIPLPGKRMDYGMGWAGLGRLLLITLSLVILALVLFHF